MMIHFNYVFYELVRCINQTWLPPTSLKHVLNGDDTDKLEDCDASEDLPHGSRCNGSIVCIDRRNVMNVTLERKFEKLLESF